MGILLHLNQRHEHLLTQDCMHQEDPVSQDKPIAPLTWAQRLKRVFNIDVTVCPLCGGTMRRGSAGLAALPQGQGARYRGVVYKLSPILTNGRSAFFITRSPCTSDRYRIGRRESEIVNEPQRVLTTMFNHA
jgi:hypothetical protein